MIILFLAIATGCHKSPVQVPWQQTMLDTVNAWRTRGCLCGTDTMPPVAPLVWNDTLAAAAQAHATDMLVHDYFAHIAPNGSSPLQRAAEAGFAGDYVGENIAEGFTTLTSVMQAWKNSPDHCQNMMDSTWTTLGAATAGNYWDQEFGGY
ncbi:CAP domain-containing protein [Dinghuibacter silviterrae]|uniref:CAP domain-containing protein n=1 Tax=Dinghuibacter silviterrae TaxID=1539049 RepID=UPI0013C335F7|nr:CAP domain-containing protein [Dinghuibacter silviterrae]